MNQVLQKLGEVTIPHQQIEEFQNMELRREFAERLRRQLEKIKCRDRRVHEWADQLIELYNTADLATLRTDGIRLLSYIIMGAFGRLDDSGSLISMPLIAASEMFDTVKDPDGQERYKTWCPSTMFAEAHPEIEVLLVGQAPAFNENKVGIPLIDYENLTKSACIECVNFERCFVGTTLVEKGKPDYSRRLLGCDFKECDSHQYERHKAMVVGMKCHTAGEVLRHALIQAGMVRPCWQVGVRENQVVAACTNAVRTTTLEESSTGVRNGQPTEEDIVRDEGWLWLEAALILPKATVLLGSDALLSYQLASGSKRKPGANPFDLMSPFGVVYKTYHPSYIMRKHGNRVFNPKRLVEDIEGVTPSRQSLVPGGSHHELGAFTHLIDVLISARKLARQQNSLLEGIGECSNILPIYLLGGSSDSQTFPEE